MQRRTRVPRASDLSDHAPERGRRSQTAGIKALGYVRAQRSSRSVDSEFALQIAAIDRFCVSQRWNLVDVVFDIEPNRKRLGRPSLTHAIDRLRSGDASCLVVAELKRLCPSVAELAGVLDAIEQAGARLVSLDPPIDSATRSGREALRVLDSVSGWERTRRAEMTTAARAKVAVPTIEPMLKRRIVRMRGAGMTLQAIADVLNDEGVPTVRGGAKWRPSSVQTALGYRAPHVWG
jgi:DNA invertase Pin-like site-specific DNA recombinase